MIGDVLIRDSVALGGDRVAFIRDNIALGRDRGALRMES